MANISFKRKPYVFSENAPTAIDNMAVPKTAIVHSAENITPIKLSATTKYGISVVRMRISNSTEIKMHATPRIYRREVLPLTVRIE